MDENELSHAIIGAAIEVHRKLGGTGLLEDVYEQALCHELHLRGFPVERQVKVPVVYKGLKIKHPLCLDVLVGGKVTVEVKAVEKCQPIFQAQLLTYLRLAGKRLGLLVNFGERHLASGIQRVANQI